MPHIKIISYFKQILLHNKNHQQNWSYRFWDTFYDDDMMINDLMQHLVVS